MANSLSILRAFLRSLGVSLLLLVGLLLVGCSSVSPPSNPNNICDIFEDKPDWYKAGKKSEERWGTSIPVMFSIMYQESAFVQKARPPRTKILWIFPGPRASDAYGFAQVKSDTWGDYQADAGSVFSRRDNFKDAIDFIGWYNAKSESKAKIKRNDAYNLYLAYHEGWGGFTRKTYASKSWLKSTAQKVATRSSDYEKQLRTCENNFSTGHWWWPF